MMYNDAALLFGQFAGFLKLTVGNQELVGSSHELEPLLSMIVKWL